MSANEALCGHFLSELRPLVVGRSRGGRFAASSNRSGVEDIRSGDAASGAPCVSPSSGRAEAQADARYFRQHVRRRRGAENATQRRSGDEEAIADAAVVRFDAFPAAREKDVALSVELDRDRPGESAGQGDGETGHVAAKCRGSASDRLRTGSNMTGRILTPRQHWNKAEESDAKAGPKTIDRGLMIKSEQIFSNGWRRHAGVCCGPRGTPGHVRLFVAIGRGRTDRRCRRGAKSGWEAALPDGARAPADLRRSPTAWTPNGRDRLIAGAIAEGGAEREGPVFSPDPGALWRPISLVWWVVLNPQIEAPNAETCRSPERIRTGPATEEPHRARGVL